jgi:PEP-CTERM motif
MYGKLPAGVFKSMMSRAFRSAVAILSILLLSGVPAFAAPVALREVIQVLGSHRSPPELRLRSVSQSAAGLMAEGQGRSPFAWSAQANAVSQVFDIGDTATTNAGDNALLLGVAISVDPQGGIDVIDQGNVEGTICDCGEIMVPGGIPKWPLLFLAAIPFFFLPECDECDGTTPPGPPPPPASMPEPASLLLLGSGLAAIGAGLRRRYTRGKLIAQIQNTEEG